MRVSCKRQQEILGAYTWPVANALLKLEEALPSPLSSDASADPILIARRETIELCLKYATHVVAGIAEIAPPVLPSYQESLYRLTKGIREDVSRIFGEISDLFSNIGYWVKDLGTDYRFEHNDD